MAKCVFATLQVFYLQIPKGAHDIFTLVVNLLGGDWMLKQIITNLFEAFIKHQKTTISLRPFKPIWLGQKDFCLCQKMKVQDYIPL